MSTLHKEGRVEGCTRPTGGISARATKMPGNGCSTKTRRFAEKVRRQCPTQLIACTRRARLTFHPQESSLGNARSNRLQCPTPSSLRIKFGRLFEKTPIIQETVATESRDMRESAAPRQRFLRPPASKQVLKCSKALEKVRTVVQRGQK